MSKHIQLHSTYKPDTYYTAFNKLPKKAREKLKKAKVIIENSRYTVYEDMAFIRAEIEVNDKLWEAEISLGSVDIRNSDYRFDDDEDEYVDELGRVVDSDKYAEHIAEELWAITELDHVDVYLTFIKDA